MRCASALLFILGLAACDRTSLLDAQSQTDVDDDGDAFAPGDGDSGPVIGDGVVQFGQPTSTTNSNLEFGMEVPSGVARCGDRLFVVDQYHHRVLVWNALPARGQPDLVLGQPTMTTRVQNYSGIDARGLFFPDSIACNADALVVSDSSNNRVNIWRPLPTESFAPASVVLGQQSFATNAVTTPSATTLNAPRGVAIFAGMLAVADTNYHRVLVWTTLPTANGAPASFALGQANLTSGGVHGGGTVNRNGLASPQGVASDGTRFFVADTSNNRVLVWNALPVQSAQPDFVLGQTSFTTVAAPGTVNASTLAQPAGFGFTASGGLVIADTAGSRMKVHTSAIAADNQAAEFSFGVSIHQGAALPVYGPSTLASPRSLLVVGSEVYVADTYAHRVLVFGDTVLANDGSGPIAVLGQPNLQSGAKRAPENGVDGRALGLPMDVAIAGTQTFVVDFLYHRVLVWNTRPSSQAVGADFALGQASLFAYDPHAQQNDGASFLFPSAVAVADGDLYVVDRDHHRVLVWDGLPTAERPADRVLGQPSLSDIAVHPVMDGASFRQPTNVTTDGTRFAIADSSNNRVLVWNTLPTASNDEADVVLGQAAMNEFFANSGGLSASSLRSVRDMAFTPDGMAVADTGNNRVLIWSSMPTTNKQPADLVLGQSAMDQADVQAATRSSTPGAIAVHYADGLFYVSGPHRILVWRGMPTTTNQPADYVIGQRSFTTNLANDGGITIDTLHAPFNIVSDGTDIVIADVENDRVLRRPRPAP